MFIYWSSWDKKVKFCWPVLLVPLRTVCDGYPEPLWGLLNTVCGGHPEQLWAPSGPYAMDTLPLFLGFKRQQM